MFIYGSGTNRKSGAGNSAGCWRRPGARGPAGNAEPCGTHVCGDFLGVKIRPEAASQNFHEEGEHDELVFVRDIPLYSVCEHHLLPFIGKCHIAYIPRDGKIIGLSKFARIVDCFARRPQVQERLTAQIADFIEENLNPRGVAVFIEAEHLCMTMRGARAAGALTQTSALRGCMRTEAKTRNEVMLLLAK